jgi:hypothetical protein
VKKKNQKPNHSLKVLHEIYKEDLETSAEFYLGRKMTDEECLEAYKLFSISLTEAMPYVYSIVFDLLITGKDLKRKKRTV